MARGLVLAGCGGGEKSAATGGGDKADLVVYGKIFTSEDNKIVEAFAVKDGKFVYVGDKAGAEPFIEKGKTEVIDYSGKGLVMPGCGNGHAHYSAGHAIQAVGTVFDKSYPLEKLFAESIPAAVKKLAKSMQKLFSAPVGTEIFRWTFLIANGLTQFAVTFRFTSRTKKVTKAWRTRLRLSTRVSCRRTALSSKKKCAAA